MFDNVFKRVEMKYLLDEETKDEFLKLVQDKLVKDKYFYSEISNIYFDNSNNDLIVNSIEKPIFKEKIRLRGYQVTSINDDVFLEVKFKYKGVVGKRRIKMKLSEFYDYFNEKKVSDNQIMRELDYYIKYYNLKPSIYIGYDRISYYSKEDDLRVTIDSNLKSRRDNLRLEFGRDGKNFFDSNVYIMEIKSLNSIPLWLSKVLCELKIFPISFSKYGSIYNKEMEDMYVK